MNFSPGWCPHYQRGLPRVRRAEFHSELSDSALCVFCSKDQPKIAEFNEKAAEDAAREKRRKMAGIRWRGTRHCARILQGEGPGKTE
jgi:hypothetical protein